MSSSIVDSARIRAAWQGRVCDCLLGKPLEVLSFEEGRDGLERYLEQVDALPLRGYVPMIKGTVVERTGAAAAVRFEHQLEPGADSVNRLHEHFAELSPVHTLNNLALVVWALNTASGDFAAAIGNAVAAGWDTDCNGATVGGLFGLTGAEIPSSWTLPWAGRVGVDLAGQSELPLNDLVDRTVAVANEIALQADAST